MSEVKATQRKSFDDLKNPGDYLFGFDHPDLLVPWAFYFICPCGCGDETSIVFDDKSRGWMHDHPRWQWNGSVDKPSFTPSILRTINCKWHGYLTDGMFKTC